MYVDYIKNIVKTILILNTLEKKMYSYIFLFSLPKTICIKICHMKAEKSFYWSRKSDWQWRALTMRIDVCVIHENRVSRGSDRDDLYSQDKLGTLNFAMKSPEGFYQI